MTNITESTDTQTPEMQNTYDPTSNPGRRAGDFATGRVVNNPDSIGSVDQFNEFVAKDTGERTDFEKDLRDAAANETPVPQPINRDDSLDDFADNNSAWETKDPSK